MEILLSVSTTPVIGWIAQLLGWIMNAIYWVLDANPHSKRRPCHHLLYHHYVSASDSPPDQAAEDVQDDGIIQPEIQKIQKKYQGKRDQATQMKIQEETMGLYQKYGISPTELSSSADPAADPVRTVSGYLSYSRVYQQGRQYFQRSCNEIIGISNSHEVLTAFAEANKISVSNRRQSDPDKGY